MKTTDRLCNTATSVVQFSFLLLYLNCFYIPEVDYSGYCIYDLLHRSLSLFGLGELFTSCSDGLLLASMCGN